MLVSEERLTATELQLSHFQRRTNMHGKNVVLLLQKNPFRNAGANIGFLAIPEWIQDAVFVLLSNRNIRLIVVGTLEVKDTNQALLIL